MTAELTPAGALINRRPIHDGEQIIARFPNGYGASIVRFTQFTDGLGFRDWITGNPGSYGGNQGLWEVAVITFRSEGWEDFKIVYDTPITDDVLGHLTESDVLQVCAAIQALPPAANCLQIEQGQP